MTTTAHTAAAASFTNAIKTRAYHAAYVAAYHAAYIVLRAAADTTTSVDESVIYAAALDAADYAAKI